MRSSEIKATYAGKSAVFPEPVSLRTTFPPTLWATLRGRQLLTQGKKVHRGGGKRIIFKKEHNLTFLSAAHPAPPPHPLVFPPASPLHFPPSLSPRCSLPRSSHVSPLCRTAGHQLGHRTGGRPCTDSELRLSSEGGTGPSFLRRAPNARESKHAFALGKPCLGTEATRERTSICAISYPGPSVMPSSLCA